MNGPGGASPESFLRLIERSRRGRLKVYLGYGPGVGKTYQMLLEGHRLKAAGVDVVIAYVEDHGRADTQSLTLGLETVPRQTVTYRGIELGEMDVAAVVARAPQVALVDELAHTNVPGSRHGKRYEDVLDLLEAGISVITTVNVQHLESLYDTVERLVGVRVKERVPDWVLADADQVVHVDLATEDLHRRMEEGKIYPRERIAASLSNFFRPENLEQLRELTLREAASLLERRSRRARPEERVEAPDQIVVCLSSRGPQAAALLRYTSRLAGKLDRTWYALHVETPDEDPLRIAAATQRHLADTLALANQLGGTVFTYKARDVVRTVLEFAREHRIGHVVIGRPGRRPWWRRLLAPHDLVERLIAQAEGLTVVVVNPSAPSRLPAPVPAVVGEATRPVPARPRLSQVLESATVVFFDAPVTKSDVLAHLVASLARRHPSLEAAVLEQAVRRREQQGSTFLEEGIGLPHVRLAGLARPYAALGLLRAGMVAEEHELLVEVVFLFLVPEEDNALALHLLAASARLFRDRTLRRELLARGRTEAEVIGLLAASEAKGSRQTPN